VRIGTSRTKDRNGMPLLFWGRLVPWPSSARGFLYFHRSSSPDNHPAAGSLRFRCVESPQGLPHAFDGGMNPNPGPPLGARAFDLTVDAGGYQVPWAVPLVALRRVPRYSPIWQQLQNDSLVTPQQCNEIDRFLEDGPQGNRVFGGRRVLDDIKAPWILNLDFQQASLMVLAEDKIYTLRLRELTSTMKGRKSINGKQGTLRI
jgi:hypothetical protein